MFGKNKSIGEILTKSYKEQEESVVHSAPVIKLERPLPETIVIDKKPVPNEYNTLVAELGIQHTIQDIDSHNLMSEATSWFLDNGIPIYNNEKVLKYLHEYCRAQGNNYYYNFVSLGNYKEPIPIEILQNIKKINDSSFWKDGRFDAIDYSKEPTSIQTKFNILDYLHISIITHDPDPFIGLLIPKNKILKFVHNRIPDNSRLIFFGVWDEPGFKLTK